MASPELKPKEYTLDFGNELEEVIATLLEGNAGFSEITHASKWDDQFGKVDLIVTLTNGEKLAVQLSATDSPEVMRKKLDYIVRNPLLTEQHDDTGKVVSNEIMPIALVGIDKNKWAKPESVNKKKEVRAMIERMIQSLTFAKGYRRDKPQLFDTRIKALEQSLQTIQ
ncbi:MAG: hypothetical protein AAB590_03920 [Patescibacteria group bacterium]